MSVSCWIKAFITLLNAICAEKIETNGHPISVHGAWASNIRSWCKNISNPREGKTVYIGSTFKDIHFTSESGEEKVIRNRIVYEMTERTSMANGQLLLVPDVELNMFWTNLGDSDEDIIALYHAHGECEQFLELTVLAYNILRMIGHEAVRQGNAPAKRIVSRKWVRTVIQNLIHFAGHFTRHARQLLLSISRSNAWADCFLALAKRFCFA